MRLRWRRRFAVAMDQATIEGCYANADRAEQVLKGLTEEWRVYIESNPWPSRVDDRTDPPWHCIYIDFTAPPPPRFAVIVGEIAHDLRSALDHLAWREAVERIGLQQAESDTDYPNVSCRTTTPLPWGPRHFLPVERCHDGHQRVLGAIGTGQMNVCRIERLLRWVY